MADQQQYQQIHQRVQQVFRALEGGGTSTYSESGSSQSKQQEFVTELIRDLVTIREKCDSILNRIQSPSWQQQFSSTSSSELQQVKQATRELAYAVDESVRQMESSQSR